MPNLLLSFRPKPKAKGEWVFSDTNGVELARIESWEPASELEWPKGTHTVQHCVTITGDQRVPPRHPPVFASAPLRGAKIEPSTEDATLTLSKFRDAIDACLDPGDPD